VQSFSLISALDDRGGASTRAAYGVSATDGRATATQENFSSSNGASADFASR